MKLAFSTNAYRRTSLPEAIARIAQCGYRAVEIMADEPHLWPATTTDEQIDEIRRALDAHALTISNINAFMMCAVEDFWHPSWMSTPTVDRAAWRCSARRLSRCASRRWRVV